MDKQTQHQWISYWQRSLQDEALLAAGPAHGQGIWLSFEDLRENHIPAQSKRKTQAVLVSPWTYAPIGIRSPRPLPVLWIGAWLTHGELLPDYRIRPWINHRILAPSDGQLLPLDIRSSEQHADSLSWPTDATWTQWLNLALSLLPEDWQMILYDAGFTPLPQASCILVRDRVPLATALHKAYQSPIPDTPLLRRYFQVEPIPFTPPEKGNVPLLAHFSESFRTPDEHRALSSILALEEGGIYALTAPRGTGATSLIQDTWANLWVQAALHGERPPVNVVSSTAPQSIFHSLTDLRLQSDFARWLPEPQKRSDPEESWDPSLDDGPFSTYPDAQKNSAIPNDFLGVLLSNDPNCCREATLSHLFAHSTHGQEGFWTLQESSQCVKEATLRFLLCARSAADEDPNRPVLHTLEEAFDWIKKNLRLLQEEYLGIQALFLEAQHGPNRTPLCTVIPLQLDYQLAQARTELAKYRALLSDWDTRVRLSHQVSLIDRITGLTPRSQLHDYLTRRAPGLLSVFTEKCETGVTQTLLARVQQWEDRCAELERLRPWIQRQIFLNGSLRAALTRAATSTTWTRWIQVSKTPNPPYPENPEDTRWQHWLDRTWRRALFALTVHYWECRWLLESIRQPQAKNQRELWQRRAMLSPVHFADLSVVPEFFEIDSGGEAPLDYLIIQDAQLARPKSAYPAIRLARRLIAIGDPRMPAIFRYGTESLDTANLQDFGLPTEGPGSLFRTYGGSVLAVAQRHVRMGEILDEPEYPGLTEQKYAAPAILSVCNELAYHGTLRPIRSETEQTPFPAIGYYPVSGVTECLPTGNRRNLVQAEAIAGWVNQHLEEIRSFYTAPGDYYTGTDPLTSILLVLTPFPAQAAAIRKALSRTHRLRIRCGTVQSFQGRAAPIVLFAPGYDIDEEPVLLERYPQILTAALALAQDSFLIFGGPKGSPHSPWEKLIARSITLATAKIVHFSQKESSLHRFPAI